MNSDSDYMDLIVFNSKKGCEIFIIRYNCIKSKYKNGTNRKAKFSYAAIGVLLLGLVSYDSKNSGLNN